MVVKSDGQGAIMTSGATKNEYLYNPITKDLEVVKMDFEHNDSGLIYAEMKDSDFSEVYPELIIKDIVNPENVDTEMTTEILEKFDEWIRIFETIKAPKWQAVETNSSLDLAKKTIIKSLYNNLWSSIFRVGPHPTRDKQIIWDSLWAVVWCYICSFNSEIDTTKFKCVLDLWNAGYIPTCTGDTWRLHKMSDYGRVKCTKKEGDTIVNVL